jgi:hypothetical protein
MRLILLLLLCAAASACLLPAGVSHADEMSFEQMAKTFHDVPMDARRYVGPLFWLHGDESKERLEMYVGKVAEGGNGCFTAESRPHVDWLGEGWWRDLGLCLEAAKKNDLNMWIFDEKWWPSGEVDKKVPPEFRNKRMVAEQREVRGPAAVEEAGCAGPNFIAVLAGKQGKDGIDGGSLVDLADKVQDGVLHWSAPEGNWVVMRFTWEMGDHILVDGASKDAVDWYLKTVYQPHFDHFGEEYGKHIRGYFYDEPETWGDWGSEVLPVLKERGVDWKKALVAWKFKLAGDEQAAAKYQYQDAFAEAWGRTLYGGISNWCKDHKVESIGHFLEHRKEYLNQNLCGGNQFQLQKFTDMGCIDAVFDQFVMGKRIARDAPCWETPKLGSSITHAYGKRDDRAMVEIFGARGQDLTYPEMKWWADHMFVSGINFLIPHSFNPRAPYDTDCPPYFYNGGFEPRFALYHVWADYASRLSMMLQGGKHVCPVALLFLGGSAHVGKAVTPEDMTDAIQDSLYDCDWIPYEVFQRDMQIDAGALALRDERYQALIVPPVEVIPYETLVKVRDFFQQGGAVVGYGFLPSKSSTLGHGADQIAALCKEIWGDAHPGGGVCKTSADGGRSFLLPEKPSPEALHDALAGNGVAPVVDVLEGDTNHWVHALHRVKAGSDLFFITNQNHEGKARRLRMRVTAKGVPECWDPMRNAITPLEYVRKGEQVEFTFTFEPLQSVLVVFRPESQGGVPPNAPTATLAVTRDATPPQPPSKPEPQDKMTLSPIVADPFYGHCEVPTGIDLAKAHLYAEMDDPAPENAARITVNDQYAGGFIGRPCRLEVTSLLKAGANTLRIEPFAPKSVRLVCYAP